MIPPLMVGRVQAHSRAIAAVALAAALVGCAAPAVTPTGASAPRPEDGQRLVKEDRTSISRVWFIKCTYGSVGVQRPVGVPPALANIALLLPSPGRTISFWALPPGAPAGSFDPRRDPGTASVRPGGEFYSVIVHNCPPSLAHAVLLATDAGSAEAPLQLGTIPSTFPEPAPNLNLFAGDAIRVQQEVVAGRMPLSRGLRDLTAKHVPTLKAVLGATRLDDAQRLLVADRAYGGYLDLTARSVEQGLRVLGQMQVFVNSMYAGRAPDATAAYWGALEEALVQFRQAKVRVAELQQLTQSRQALAKDQAWQEARTRNACTLASPQAGADGPSEKEMCNLLVGRLEAAQASRQELIGLLSAPVFGPAPAAMLSLGNDVVEANVVKFRKRGICAREDGRPSHQVCEYVYEVAYRRPSTFAEMMGSRGVLPDSSAYFRDASGTWQSTWTLKQEAAQAEYSAKLSKYMEEHRKWEECRRFLPLTCGPEPMRP